MKIPFLLCALVLSTNGWCANATSSPRTVHSVAPLQVDNMATTVMGWILVAYLSAIIWWAIAAKHSLDKILKDVLQDIGQYP